MVLIILVAKHFIRQLISLYWQRSEFRIPIYVILDTPLERCLQLILDDLELLHFVLYKMVLAMGTLA